MEAGSLPLPPAAWAGPLLGLRVLGQCPVVQAPLSAVGEMPAVGLALLCLFHPATPGAAGSASPGPEGWLPKPQPTRGLGSPRERCRGGEEQARSVQSTDKMGMGCAPWGPMALGALPLCIWGPGRLQNGASFLWGRAEPGVGGEPQTGMGTCSASEMLADHCFCQHSSRLGLWGDVSQPQGRFWTRISLYLWPRSAGGGCMDEGKDGERGGDDERGQSSDWSRELEAP